MRQFIRKHRYYLFFQALALLLLIIYTRFSESGLDDGDSITHYFISRYSWVHHQLFLDNWGKPFFILFSAPFSRFGFWGIQAFNIICAVISGWFCYRIAGRLHIRPASPAPVFLFFIPIYFIHLPSGLTEPFFGLVLIASVYLLLTRRWAAAAILVSFLPFCRSEGWLLLPLFGLWLWYCRQWLAPFLLATGFLVYSAIGYFVNHDFLWLIHTNPYHGIDLYGHGSFWMYISFYRSIFGETLAYLFIIASVCHVIKIFRGNIIFSKPGVQADKDSSLFEIFMIWAGVLIYVGAHSWFWYKGIFGSAGMWRVMAAIAPLFSITALRGLSVICIPFRWNRAFYIFPALAITVWIIIEPIQRFHWPLRLEEDKLLIKQASQWVKDQGLQDRKIFYTDPFVKMLFNLDPWDEQRGREMMFIWRGNDFGKDIPAGSIIIWESRLGPREEAVPLEKLTDTKNFTMLRSYKAKWQTTGDQKFSVYVFEKR